MITAIVLGYGVFQESNQEYKDYLDWICKTIKDRGIEKLVICGGFTNPQLKDVSEAQSIYTYLKLNLPVETSIVLEEKSITTPQNLEFAKEEISAEDNILIFCDLARLAKVIWLSSRILLGKTQSEIGHAVLDFYLDKKIKPFDCWNLTVMSFDFPSRDKYQYFAQSFTGLIEVESLDDKSLDEKIITQRKKDFGIN
ncbi:hypothetical protein A2572_01990 [Candidatus Collierbacteria bacterium RIFOXYD1_FULL_40_9]|uniref:DUF218 domain-containing protein n=1 Tax=Candidatus Collierbacteria bacterium RIFOXYD1_FULL_40_9 TaxID=1817731 RepID=A0A1F5FTB9_9BACT|nr:MAG: hypothetical protein A2572_01990 [Candidatus Collierbacteria bacterium RIFOXYD1_FULL_40_9]